MKKSNPYKDAILGALFEFMGYMTTEDEPFTPHELLKLYTQWIEKKGFVKEECNSNINFKWDIMYFEPFGTYLLESYK